MKKNTETVKFTAFDATFGGDAPYFNPSLINLPFNNHCKIIKNTPMFCLETRYQFAAQNSGDLGWRGVVQSARNEVGPLGAVWHDD